MNSTYKQFTDDGYILVPIWDLRFENGKKVIIPESKWNKLTLDDSKQYINRSMKGIGIRLGEINNLMVFDIDDPNDYIKALNQPISTIFDFETPLVRTKKGFHLYFQYDPNFSKKIVKVNETEIDILTNECFAIMPPTTYSNNTYRWITNEETGIVYDFSIGVKPFPQILKDFINKVEITSYIDEVDTDFDNMVISDQSTEILNVVMKGLAQHRADNYGEWVNVLIALFNTETYEDEYLYHAMEFSKRSKKYKESDFASKWRSITITNDQKKLTINNFTMFNSLRVKLPEFEFSEVVKLIIKLHNIENIIPDNSGYEFNASGTCICGINTNTYKVYSIDNYLILKCDHCKGKRVSAMHKMTNLGKLCEEIQLDKINKFILIDNNIVYLSNDPDVYFNTKSTRYRLGNETNEKYLIADKNLNIDSDLSRLFPTKYNVTASDWIIKTDNDHIKLCGENDPTNPQLQLIGRFDDPNNIKIKGSVGSHMNKPSFNLNKSDTLSVCNHTNNAIQKYLSKDIGMTIINYNTTIINTFEESKINEVLIVDTLLKDKSLDDIIIETADIIYVFDEENKLWEHRPIKTEIGKTLIDKFKKNYGDKIDLDDIFFNRTDNNRKIYNELINFSSKNKKDAKIRVKELDNKEFLFPFDNMVYDLENHELRDITREDYIRITTGYNIRPRESIPQEEFDLIESFYAKIFPNLEERIYFQRIVASCLPKSTTEKMFVVLTDQSEGNNGKSTIMNCISRVFGNLSCIGTISLLTDDNDTLNGHTAGLFDYINKRFTIIEESTSSKPLNITRIKNITGGGDSMITLRNMYSSHSVTVQWTATPFITCNNGEFLKIKVDDVPLVKRIKVVPFRSNFEHNIEDDYEKNIYKIDYELVDKVKKLRDTHFYILIDAYKVYKKIGLPSEPEYAKLFKERLIEDSDSLYGAISEYISERIKITGIETDFIQRKDLISHFRQYNNNIYADKRKYKQRSIETLFNKSMKNKDIEYRDKAKINNIWFRSIYIGITRVNNLLC